MHAAVLLGDGTSVTGHIYTAVLYVETTNETRKVILFAKQRGAEGAGLESVVYPVRIAFGSGDGTNAPTLRVRFPLAAPPGAAAQGEFCALTWGAMARLPGRPADAPGEYLIPSPFGVRLFGAAQVGGVLHVAWPAPQDDPVAAAVRRALADVRDFFDARELLGLYREPSSPDTYALMMLTRKGATTMDGDRTQPWRLEVWRWRSDEDGQRVMLAGRGYFFRGILAPGEKPPPVQQHAELWPTQTNGVMLVFGGP